MIYSYYGYSLKVIGNKGSIANKLVQKLIAEYLADNFLPEPPEVTPESCHDEIVAWIRWDDRRQSIIKHIQANMTCEAC